ncbi:amidohydrolase family protein, partial [Bacteroidota bacterium]
MKRRLKMEMKYMFVYTINKTKSFILLLFLISCSANSEYDLLITNARLFDVNQGKVQPGVTIAIKNGLIAEVYINQPSHKLKTAKTLDTKGKLVTPGFIDVHHHYDMLFPGKVTPGGGVENNLSMHQDSINAYRKLFTEAYIPFGVTTVRDAGANEKHFPMWIEWMKPVYWAPDFYPCGGALVSYKEGIKPYSGHVALKDSIDAVNKIQEYYDKGLRHIKLYWKLEENEFDLAIEKAKELGMNMCGHIDYKIVSIKHALDKGLRTFEHAFTLGVEILTSEEISKVYNEKFLPLVKDQNKARYFIYITSIFNYIGKDNPGLIKLIDLLKKKNASVTPTLHVIAQRFGISYFTSVSVGDFDNTSWYGDPQVNSGLNGYEVLESYVKMMFDKGIHLNLGTDTGDPGKSVLSEMLLLHRAGIPMADVLKIATLNS